MLALLNVRAAQGDGRLAMEAIASPNTAPRARFRSSKRKGLLMRGTLCTLLVAFSLLLSEYAVADTVILNSGVRYEGRVIADTDEALVFEVYFGSSTMRQTIPKARIRDLVVTSGLANAYAPIPISGTIGFRPGSDSFVTVDHLQAALTQLRRNQVLTVVLVVDSPGGNIAEMEKIVKLIASTPDTRFVAYVQDALSAAAIISMGCTEIVMAPDARIGAAVPWTWAPDGTPANVEEKFRSVYRALASRTAERAGHNPLLVQGMIDADLELTLEERDGIPHVFEGLPKTGDHLVLKERGRILVLTAEEAVQCGLAIAICESVEDIGAILGIDGWDVGDSRAWETVLGKMRTQRKEYERLVAAERRRAEQEEYVESVMPDLNRIDERFLQLYALMKANEDTKLELQRQRDWQLQNASSRYRIEFSQTYDYARSNAAYGREVAEIRGRYEERVILLDKETEAAAMEITMLRQKVDAIVSAAP